MDEARPLTAAFPRLSLERVASWAAANGFSMLEVACWPGPAASAAVMPASRTSTSSVSTPPR